MDRQVDQPALNVVGDRVALGPLGPAHAAHLHRWQNDYAVMRGWEYLPGPRSVEEVRRRFEPGQFFADPQNVAFAVYETGAWGLVGYAGLYHVDHVNKIAEYFVMVGEAAQRGKGYGTEATRLVLDYGFAALDLHNVWLWTASPNERAIRAYARAGFKEIGRRREAGRLGGEVCDLVLMDCLATEFVPPATRALALP